MPLGYVAAGPELHWVINFLPHCSHSASHRADVACLRTDPLDSRACPWKHVHTKVDATTMLGWGWGMLGSSFYKCFYISNKKNQVSFIPTHPPTTCVHMRLVDHTGSMHYMLGTSHLGRPYRVSAFAALHHLQAFNWCSHL